MEGKKKLIVFVLGGIAFGPKGQHFFIFCGHHEDISPSSCRPYLFICMYVTGYVSFTIPRDLAIYFIYIYTYRFR